MALTGSATGPKVNEPSTPGVPAFVNASMVTSAPNPARRSDR